MHPASLPRPADIDGRYAVKSINVPGPDGRTYTLHAADFEKGVIVSYPPLAGATSSPLPWNSTQVGGAVSRRLRPIQLLGL